MSSPRTVEETALKPVEAALRPFITRFSQKDEYAARLSILEGVAARLGGFSVRSYQKTFNVDPLLRSDDLEKAGAVIASALSKCGIHPALALSALAREPIDEHSRRSTGAHHTDFRLAMMLGQKAAEINPERRPIVDPACGAGILLVATTLATLGSDRTAISSWLTKSVYASDISDAALRGSRLALASLTDDLSSIETMASRWAVGDSLMRTDWAAPSGGFGAVVANPPWEKVKVSRHENALASGKQRIYGSAFDERAQIDLLDRRAETRGYASTLARRYPIAASGEMDLYAAFAELMIELSGDAGGMAVLIPAGIIRSQGTKQLREALVGRFEDLDVTIIDNKARFFSIDTRFKFVLLAGGGEKSSRAGRIQLSHAVADDWKATPLPAVAIPVRRLRELRPDLTVPEVRSKMEWNLFAKLASSGRDWGAHSETAPKFAREVDMTKERPLFRPRPEKSSLPVIEGRMVHHCRVGVKSYLGGQGRSATWRSNPIGRSRIEPQFWIPSTRLPVAARERSRLERVGFCDIAGQTNERSMSGAIIPVGVVCGNKVPTVVFADDNGGLKARLWCGLVNSFVFDWMLRRVLTTTVNYFLLQSLPLPPIQPGSLPGRRIVDAVRRIEELDRSGCEDAAWAIAEQRSIIDGICFRSYGLSGKEISLILDDFPSLDRSQPALAGERRSTITRDFLLQDYGGFASDAIRTRVTSARDLGAVPYVPSQNGEEVPGDKVRFGT